MILQKIIRREYEDTKFIYLCDYDEVQQLKEKYNNRTYWYENYISNVTPIENFMFLVTINEPYKD